MKKLLALLALGTTLFIAGCGESATEKQINEYAKAEAPAYTIANIDARSRERFNVEVNIPAKYSKEQVEAISKQVSLKSVQG